MKSVAVAVLGLVGLWVVACSSPSSSSSDEGPYGPACKPGEKTMPYYCSCDDGRSAPGTLDACNGAPVDACDCGKPRDCASDLGCPGTQLCRGDDCGPCQCAPPQVLGTTSGVGEVVDMSSDGQGHLALLLNAAPWLETLDASGALQPVPVQSDLSWARWVWAAPNGTVVALGSPQAAPSKVQFQRFDASGELVGSGSWAFPDGGAALAAVAHGVGASVALVASAADKLAFLSLSDKGEISLVATVPMTAEDASGCCSNVPTSFAVAPNGDYLLAGQLQSYRVDGVWWGSFDSSGRPIAAQSDRTFDLFYSSPLVAASAAGNFSAWSWSFSDFQPTQSYVARLDLAQSRVWTNVSKEKSATGVVDLVALPDSVLTFGAIGLVAHVERYTRGGAQFDVPLTLPDRPARAVVLRDYELAVLSRPYPSATFDLTFMQLRPLAAGGQPLDSACSADSDCSSSHCCRRGSAASGVCGAAEGCGFAAHCASAADCASGDCLAPPSVCSQSCQKSKDCPSGSYCVSPCQGGACDSSCLPDCLAAGDAGCAASGSWSCAATANVEGVQVSVCGG